MDTSSTGTPNLDVDRLGEQQPADDLLDAAPFHRDNTGMSGQA